MSETINLPGVFSRIKPTVLTKRMVLALARHGLFFVNLLIAIWVGLPWLAPVMMHWGWTGAARAIYFLYSLQCHQLQERSFFLFGRQAMYSLAEIQAAWQQTNDPFFHFDVCHLAPADAH